MKAPSHHHHHTSRLPVLFLLLLVVVALVVRGEDTAASAAAEEEESVPDHNPPPVPAVPEEEESSSSTPSIDCDGKLALITGATGRVGRLVTRNLLARGFCVRVLSRNATKAHDVLGPLFDQPQFILELVVGDLVGLVVNDKDDSVVAQAFEPRDSSGGATISHVIFAAGGEHADYQAVNYRGVAECAKEAANANVQMMVLISTAWSSKPYSMASLLFNYLYPTLPMAQHYKGEYALKTSGLKNYVILRAGRLVADEEYPQHGRQGLTYKQGDSFFFWGPAGQPGMSTTQLATAVTTTATRVASGKFTVEVTGRGKVDPKDGTVFTGTSRTPPELKQDASDFVMMTDNDDIVERYHAKGVYDFQVGLVLVLVVATAFTILIPLGKQPPWSWTWKVILFVTLVLETFALFLVYWNTFRCGVSIPGLIAKEQASSAASSTQEL